MKYRMTKKVRWGKPVLNFTAIIETSKKMGIPSRVQKSWRVPFDEERCQYDEKQLKELFLTNAKRWQMQVMKRIFGEQVPELVQTEIL